jgi:hypothetical protein
MRETRDKREREKRSTEMSRPRGPASVMVLGGTGGKTQDTTMPSHDWANRWVCDGAEVVAMLCTRWQGLWCGGCSVAHCRSWRRHWEAKEEEKGELQWRRRDGEEMGMARASRCS